MSRLLVRLAPVVLLLAAASCKSKQACGSASECEPGAICQDNRCAVLCSAQKNCPPGEVCSNGVCAPPASGDLPQISFVFGNEPGDTTRIRDGLLVEGVMLANATFELVALPATYVLTIRAQTDTLAEVILPVDIRSGSYTLVAANLAGSDQVPVTLTLPELTGDLLLDRINTGATGTLSFSRLPIGTSGGTVAAGDHRHDNLYAPLPAPGSPGADGNFVPNGGFTEGVTFTAMWTIELGGSGPSYSVADVSNGIGPKALQSGPLTRVLATSNARIPVDSTRVYRVKGRFREVAAGGAGGVHLGIRTWDSSGSELLNGSAWPVYAALGQTPGTGWTTYATAFGAGTTKPLPAGAASMSLAVVLNADLGNPTIPGNRQFQVQDLAIFGYSVEPSPVRTSASVALVLTADDAGVVTLSPAANATVTLPLANAYSGLGFELYNQSGNRINVQTGAGAFVSPIAPYGRLHLVAVADPPDGANEWAIRGRGAVTETIPASGTWTVPQGVDTVHVILIGGGGGGGSGAYYAGGGGGGGGGVREILTSVVPGTAWTVSVAGGGGAGGAGGATVFAGPGGAPSYSAPGGGAGGSPPSYYDMSGGNGGAGGFGAASSAGAGGSYDVYPGGSPGALNGGGGGGAYAQAGGIGASTNQARGGNGQPPYSWAGGGGGGGASWGPGGDGGYYAVVGPQAGSVYGGGGGGGSAQQSGAAGAAGLLILRY